MIKIISLFVILSASVWLGLYIQTDPGYFLFSYGKWSLEMPLWFAMICLLAIFTIMYYLIHFYHRTGAVKGRFFRWFKARKVKASQSLTYQGLMEFSEGNWTRAEKLLLKANKNAELPFVNYLFAAESAQAQKAYQRRDKYLKKAEDVTPDSFLGIELIQSKLQLESGQLEQALAKLKHLQELSPKHSHVLKLLHQVYYQLKEWESLLDLLPAIKRLNMLSVDEFGALEREVYCGILEHDAAKGHFDVFNQHWQSFPRKIQRDPEIVTTYAKHLINFNESQLAEEIIRGIIKKYWHEDLVRLYAFSRSENPKKQLALVESWLNTYPNNAVLLLTLGRLCIVNQLWGKARSYLENSVQLSPNSENHVELAQLLEQLGESQEAIKYYKEGLLNYV